MNKGAFIKGRFIKGVVGSIYSIGNLYAPTYSTLNFHLTNHLCQSKANFGNRSYYLDFNFSETLKTRYEKIYPGNNKCRV